MSRQAPSNEMSDPMARAKRLADRMARRLEGEDVADIPLALALLTGSIVHQCADDIDHARKLIAGIRSLEDRFLASAFRDAKMH